MGLVNDFVNGGWLPILLGIMVMAAAVTVLLPFFTQKNVQQRVRIVTKEIDDLKKYERGRLDAEMRERDSTLRRRISERDSNEKVSERVRQFAEYARKFNLDSKVDDKLRRRLAEAGYRREEHALAYLVLRFVGAVGGVLLGFYLINVALTEYDQTTNIAIVCGSAILGFYLPSIMVSNTATKRKQEILLSFPDALDLLVVCVQSGMTVEAAIRRVAKEMERMAPIFCQEMHILGAELNYLKERRIAYVNFADRCGIDQIRDFSNTIIQAEAYGTSILTALRVQADEVRDDRMMRAENKANSLPAKMTVPMAAFMLPVIFFVVLTPGLVNAFRSF